MERRQFVLIAATAVFAGCSNLDSGGGDADSGDQSTEIPVDSEVSATKTETSTDTSTEAGTFTETPPETPSPSPSPTDEEPATERPTDEPSGVSGIQVKIVYEGAWQGSLATGNTSRSIDGEGTTTLDAPSDTRTVSVTAHKQDDSDRKLTVQILNDGKIVTKGSTNSPEGIIQASYTVREG